MTFAHRSFQEYFVARFISSCPPEVKGQLVSRFAPSVESDSVMSLLYELDSYTVEREYILPALDTLKKRIKLVRNVGITHFLRYIKTVWRDFQVAEQERPLLIATLNDGSLYKAMWFIYERYGSEVGRNREEPVTSLTNEEWVQRFEAEFGEGVGAPTKAMTTKMAFVRFLYGQPGHWGAQYLRDVLATEDLILERHRDAHQSLERILSSVSRRRRGMSPG